MKPYSSVQKAWRLIAVAGLWIAVASCGGNDDPVPIPPPPAPASTPTISVFAGLLQQPGSQDGVGSAAQFDAPQGIAQDSAGNVYVADTGNHTIRKVTPAGVVTTVAGLAGQKGSVDGVGTAARLSSPVGLTVDTAGAVFIADTGNRIIRQLSPAGVLTTVAGVAGQGGSANGSATVARFESPQSVAVDGVGNLYVVDSGVVTTVRKIAPDRSVAFFAQPPGPPSSAVATDSSGNVFVAQTDRTFAGGLVRKFNNQGIELLYGGVTTGVAVSSAVGLVIDKEGNAIVVSNGFTAAPPPFATVFRSILKVNPAGSVTTVAGADGPAPLSIDGPVGGARFAGPSAVAAGVSGQIVVLDTSANAVRQINAQGTVSTLAGGTGAGTADGTSTMARFFDPAGLAASPDGTLFVADSGNSLIRKVTPDGRVSTFTVTSNGVARTVHSARVLALGGDGTLFVNPNDLFSQGEVLAISPTGQLRTYQTGRRLPSVIGADLTGRLLLSFTGTPLTGTIVRVSADGSRDEIGSGLGGATALAVAATGVIYVAGLDHTIRAIDAQGRVTLVAGQAGTAGYVDGLGAAARFSSPSAMTTDTAGNLYVADATTIRKITPDGQVRTVAGTAGETRVELGLAPGSLGTVRGLAWHGGALYATVQNVVLKITLLN